MSFAAQIEALVAEQLQTVTARAEVAEQEAARLRGSLATVGRGLANLAESIGISTGGAAQPSLAGQADHWMAAFERERDAHALLEAEHAALRRDFQRERDAHDETRHAKLKTTQDLSGEVQGLEHELDAARNVISALQEQRAALGGDLESARAALRDVGASGATIGEEPAALPVVLAGVLARLCEAAEVGFIAEDPAPCVEEVWEVLAESLKARKERDHLVSEIGAILDCERRAREPIDEYTDRLAESVKASEKERDDAIALLEEIGACIARQTEWTLEDIETEMQRDPGFWRKRFDGVPRPGSGAEKRRTVLAVADGAMSRDEAAAELESVGIPGDDATRLQGPERSIPEALRRFAGICVPGMPAAELVQIWIDNDYNEAAMHAELNRRGNEPQLVPAALPESEPAPEPDPATTPKAPRRAGRPRKAKP